MNYKEVTGKGGLVTAALVAAAMSAAAFFTGTPHPLSGTAGICFPSPNMWSIPPLLSWIANLLLLYAGAGALGFINKEYSLVPGNDSLLPAAFLVLTGSIPWVSDILTSSMILGVANIICMGVIFSCFRSRNATREIFLISTILSFGSMIQYAFLFMIPVYLAAAIFLKCFRFRELLAMLMGLLAPYWIVVGLGIVSPGAFRLPSFAYMFDNFNSRSGLFFALVSISSALLLTLVLGSQNLVRLYAGNSQRRLNTVSLNTLCFVCVICMLIDYNNLPTYVVSAYVTTAVTIADFFALRRLPRPRIWLWALLLFFTALYVLILI